MLCCGSNVIRQMLCYGVAANFKLIQAAETCGKCQNPNLVVQCCDYYDSYIMNGKGWCKICKIFKIWQKVRMRLEAIASSHILICGGGTSQIMM